MAEIDVSYVITVYNKRPFLPQMIAGLAAQKGAFRREFVFVDDGSSDGSAAEIARLTADWPNVRIISQSNRGASHATNRGLAEACGRFIKLVDADDVLLPHATTALLAGMARHPEAVLAYGRTELYASRQEALDRLTQEEAAASAVKLEIDPLRRQLLGAFPIGPSNSLFLAAAARSVGGCDTRVFMQDYSLVLRLATQGAFVALAMPIALCPAAAEGRINDGGPQVLHDVNLSVAYFLNEHAVPANLARRAIQRATLRAYRWARRREGAGFFSYWAWLRLLAELPTPPSDLIRKSCDAFTLSRPVRRGAG
jgi:glycosyltransferase involved in cell wall biosynthesis